MARWQLGDRFLDLRSRWLTLIGEHWQDDQGRSLEYWRVEKAHSAIILPLWRDQLLLVKPTFRPGTNTETLDFPGGRVPVEDAPITIAPRILERELGIPPTAIQHLQPLNAQGWPVNSSFSNQALFGFVAHLDPTFAVAPGALGPTFAATAIGIQALLQELSCLQCRAVLLEWWWQTQANHPSLTANRQ